MLSPSLTVLVSPWEHASTSSDTDLRAPARVEAGAEAGAAGQRAETTTTLHLSSSLLLKKHSSPSPQLLLLPRQRAEATGKLGTGNSTLLLLLLLPLVALPPTPWCSYEKPSEEEVAARRCEGKKEVIFALFYSSRHSCRSKVKRPARLGLCCWRGPSKEKHNNVQLLRVRHADGRRSPQNPDETRA